MLYNAIMSTILLSEKANDSIKEYLREHGHSIVEIQSTEAVYDAISSHADIYLCKLGNRLLLAKEQRPFIKDDLTKFGVPYTVGSSKLGYQYPDNVKYNAAVIGNHFVHNLKLTEPALLDNAKSLGMNVIHVKQGYTKCNLVIVDGHSVITSDQGVCQALSSSGIDVLLISQGHVKLDGFLYGFLGGASGRVGNEILFHGDLSVHPDFPSIMRFIEERGLQIKYFPEYPLEDIGSIVEIESEYFLE